MLLVSCGDNTLRVWDVEKGVCLQVLEGHRGPVWSVAGQAPKTLNPKRACFAGRRRHAVAEARPTCSGWGRLAVVCFFRPDAAALAHEASSMIADAAALAHEASWMIASRPGSQCSRAAAPRTRKAQVSPGAASVTSDPR